MAKKKILKKFKGNPAPTYQIKVDNATSWEHIQETVPKGDGTDTNTAYNLVNFRMKKQVHKKRINSTVYTKTCVIKYGVAGAYDSTQSTITYTHMNITSMSEPNGWDTGDDLTILEDYENDYLSKAKIPVGILDLTQPLIKSDAEYYHGNNSLFLGEESDTDDDSASGEGPEYLCLAYAGKEEKTWNDSENGSAYTGQPVYGKYQKQSNKANGRSRYKHITYPYYIRYDGDGDNGSAGSYAIHRGAGGSLPLFYTSNEYHIVSETERNNPSVYSWIDASDLISITESSETDNCDTNLNFSITSAGTRRGSGFPPRRTGPINPNIFTGGFEPVRFSDALSGDSNLSEGDLYFDINWNESSFPDLLIRIKVEKWTSKTELDETPLNILATTSQRLVDLSDTAPQLITKRIDFANILADLPSRSGIHVVSIEPVSVGFSVLKQTGNVGHKFRWDL